ncbi:hypothetical protein PTTG_30203, partial [Puccinia triticina 1-1 BBBD Race 1]
MQQAESDYTLEGGVYYCNVCPRARGAKSWTLHVRSAAHQTHVRRRDDLRQATALAPPQPALVGDPSPEQQHPHFQQAQEDGADEQRAWARLTSLMALNNEIPGPDDNPRSLDAELVALHAGHRALP